MPIAAFTPYQKRLFVFLSVATFFEGYDFLALSQLIPELRSEFDLSELGAGMLVAFINVGTVVAYFLVRRADRWGRRRVFTATIAGYTLFTFFSGLSPTVHVFALCQLAARVFLIAEWAISMVYAAEEFPAARRGLVIGVISGAGTLGSIVCAAAVPLLIRTAWHWRTVYLVAVVPLILIAIARRSLRESHRFAAEVGTAAVPKPRLALLRGPYARRVCQLALIWGLAYVNSQATVTFWKDFAVKERALNDAQVALSISLAALVSMPLVFLIGPFLDRAGRKAGALVVFCAAACGTVGSYTFTGYWALTASLIVGIFAASGFLPVLNAFTTELFPTHCRADAFAWANNLLGRIGYVASPLVVGAIAADVGWGPSVRATAIFPLLALVLIYWVLPETKKRELEETSALSPS